MSLFPLSLPRRVRGSWLVWHRFRPETFHVTRYHPFSFLIIYIL